MAVTAIADIWPLLVIAASGFLVFAVVRLARRFSPGALSAGPRTPPDARHLGQSELADDLRTIERRLDTRPDSLIARIEQSCRELGVRTDGVADVPPHLHIDVLLQRLEHHLELGPIASVPGRDEP